MSTWIVLGICAAFALPLIAQLLVVGRRAIAVLVALVVVAAAMALGLHAAEPRAACMSAQQLERAHRVTGTAHGRGAYRARGTAAYNSCEGVI